MDSAVEIEFLLGLTRRLCCVGVLLQSTELAWHRRELRADGLLGWTVSPTPTANPARLLARWLNDYPGCRVALIFRAVAALAGVLLPDHSALILATAGSLVLAQLFYNRRFAAVGSDSDTMQLACFAAVFVGHLPGERAVLGAAALAFLAGQVLIAYAASGFDKVRSRRWRTGVQLVVIFQHGIYRCAPLGHWLERHPLLARTLTWSVILLELLFPASVLLPATAFWIILAGGLGFHAAVAVTMGLHGFWWSFAAAYPALYFVHQRLAAAFAG